MRSTDEYGGISWWDLQMSMVSSLDEIYKWVWWYLLISQSCPKGDRSRPHRSSWSPGVIGLYWYSGCSISWVSPLREDGASACPGDPGCSESQVSLRHEPSQGSRASSGTPWSVVGLARTVTILAVLETYGERSLGDADESELASSWISMGMEAGQVSSLVLY